MRISDWSSDVCSSDLESQPTPEELLDARGRAFVENQQANRGREARNWWRARAELRAIAEPDRAAFIRYWGRCKCPGNACYLLTYINMFRDGRLIVHEGEVRPRSDVEWRSEEHTSELQSLMRISYAVFCLKKKKNMIQRVRYNQNT